MNDFQQFDPNPTLINDSLLIRPLESDDFDSLYNVASDPEIWALHPQKNRYQKAVFEQWFESALKDNALLIIDNQTNSVIGSSRYYEIDEVLGEVAIGFTFLARNYWGGKTNKQLKGLMLEHAFKSFDIVWLHIAEDNMRSRKAAEKIGGVLSRTGVKSGLPYCFYQLTKNG